MKAVFLDMDGTLYSHETGSIPESARQAVDRIRQKGIKVFCATGRHRLELEQLDLCGLELDGWLTLNGAYCYTDHEVFHKSPVDRDDLKILTDRLMDDPFPCIFLEADRMYINIYNEKVDRDLKKIHTEYPEILDPRRALEHEIFQFIPYAEDEIWMPVERRMKHIRSTRWNIALDVVSAQSGKDRAVVETCRKFGIDLQDTVGIGDGPNDLDMMKAVGYRVAMGNADPALKAVCDCVTGDINEDGLAEFLCQLDQFG